MSIQTSTRESKKVVFEELFDDVLKEMSDAILVEIGKGRRPDFTSVPSLSKLDNGFPSLIDARLFSQNGPPEYLSLLMPPYGDESQRQPSKFPPERFPAFHILIEYIKDNTDLTPAYLTNETKRVIEFQVEMQI